MRTHQPSEEKFRVQSLWDLSIADEELITCQMFKDAMAKLESSSSQGMVPRSASSGTVLEIQFLRPHPYSVSDPLNQKLWRWAEQSVLNKSPGHSETHCRVPAFSVEGKKTVSWLIHCGI